MRETTGTREYDGAAVPASKQREEKEEKRNRSSRGSEVVA